MKKYVIYPLLGFISFVFILLVGAAALIFFKPGLVINPKNLSWALKHQKVLQNYSWEDAKFEFDWKKWNDRRLHGHFKKLCFEVNPEAAFVKTCLDEIHWDFDVVYDFTLGAEAKTHDPFYIRSSELLIKPKKTEKKEEFTSINVWSYWRMLWNPVVPDMDFEFAKIEIQNEKSFIFDVSLKKSPKELLVKGLDFSLKANPEGFVVLPPVKYPLPMKPLLGHKLHLYDFKLSGRVTKKEIPLEVRGKFETVDIWLGANLSLPIKDDPAKSLFRKNFLKTMTAKIVLKHIHENYKRYSPKSFPSFPAPFNVMEGDFVTNVEVKDLKGDLIQVMARSSIDLASEKQVLDLDFDTEVPLNVMSFKPDAINLVVDFQKVIIQLPRLSKKSLPPQFAPDSRIKNTPFTKPEKKVKEEPIDFDIHLEATGEKALHFKTNLLDEVLRLNFDLNIKDGEMQKGFVQILPLKTSVFKRPIHVEYTKVNFAPPLEPVIEATVKFPLPTYKVTLKLEGPISKPRYVFTSEPPLPQNDIYAVLLFGRPLDDLSPDDKDAAHRTNRILSQGILSLSVLYFLAGSPVEYVGYDAESKNATASIGIDSQTSLKVEGGSKGVNSTGVRRSLGKGWYIDTSVEKSQLSKGDSRSYGVMLERIIAY